MKIKSLHIDSYRHLQNLSFDFTYPKDHPKAGQPLEKICIIGQSATGKTSVLELIKENIFLINSLELFNGQFLLPSYQLSFKGEINYLYQGEIIRLTNDNILKNQKRFIRKTEDPGVGNINKFIIEDLKLFYFSSRIISKEALDIFNQNPGDFKNTLSSIAIERLESFTKHHGKVYEFGSDEDKKRWTFLLSKILDYRKRFTQMASEIINKGAIADPARFAEELAKWSNLNPNPLIPFAEKFNPILKKLNLEIDLVNTEFCIPIKSKINDQVVPVSGLSTGTKGLLLSMFPLYELDTNEALVLIDEPERSLFPDIQIDLMQHYQNLAPESQIIVATHSPFIAASFDPEERFILYFDNKGKVDVRRGESPKGDDPNDMLRNDFNIDYYNDFGKQAYQKYLSLKAKAKQESEPEKKKDLIIELAALGDKYNF